MSAYLHHFPSTEEIQYTLFNMGKGKALGPDEVMVEILTHQWSCAKEDFRAAILQFFTRRCMLTNLNHSKNWFKAS